MGRNLFFAQQDGPAKGTHHKQPENNGYVYGAHTQEDFIRNKDMIQNQSLITSQTADAAECSERTIKIIRRNYLQPLKKRALDERHTNLTHCSFHSITWDDYALALLI
jgi:hypothetical protein